PPLMRTRSPEGPAAIISPSTARPNRCGASDRGGSCGGEGEGPLAAQAAAIQHKADEGVTHQQMITYQHDGESGYENGHKLDRPGPVEGRHRDLQRHHD